MDRGDRNIWSALCVLVVVLAAGAYVSAGGYSRGFLPVSPSGGGGAAFAGDLEGNSLTDSVGGVVTVDDDLTMGVATDIDLSDEKLYLDKVNDANTYMSNNGTSFRFRWFTNNVQRFTIGETSATFTTDLFTDDVVNTGNAYTYQNSTKVSAPADGDLLWSDDAGTGASCLKAGGVTSSFPAMCRVGTEFHFQRADESATYGLIRAGTIENFTGSGSPGSLLNNWLQLMSTGRVQWSNSSSNADTTKDTGLDRLSAGVVEVTDGSTGTGDIQAKRFLAGGADPVLSACGTTPAVVGSDSAGKITIGTGVTTSCTVTFAAAFGAAPSCTVNGDNTAVTFSVTTTTAVLTIGSSADIDSDVINYHCIGL